MSHYEFKTIFTSTYPIDCYIIKGRLETEGITCYIFDEHLISVNPFKSFAVGGVKLKVSSDQFEKAITTLSKIEKNLLKDENGEYDLKEIVKIEFERQNNILNLKKEIQETPELLNKIDQIKKILNSNLFSENEIQQIILKEIEFQNYKQLKFKFNWKQFWYELFDFERDFFKYFQLKPIKYNLEKDILDNFIRISNEKKLTNTNKCPKCGSINIKYCHAIDYKTDILYLIFSLIFKSPFPPFRKKYHCFDCGHSFNKKDCR